MADETDPLGDGKYKKRTQRKKPKVRKPPNVIDDVEDGDVVKLLEWTKTNRADGLEAGTIVRITAIFHDTGEVLARKWDSERRQTCSDSYLIRQDVRIEGVEYFVGGNTLIPVFSAPEFGGKK